MIAFFLLAFVIIVILSIADIFFDDDRIKEAVEKKGGQLIRKERAFFGPGWINEDNNRIYRIEYLDKEGNTWEAYVKTHSLGNIYFGNERIIKPSSDIEPTESTSVSQEILIKENEALKLEINRLKAQMG